MGASTLECGPIDGVLGVLSSNQINIATFSTRWETHTSIFNLMDKSSNIYLV